MPNLTETAVLETLSTVRDPDLNRNIVELGFVKNMQIDGGRVKFDVELTTPACPVKEQLKEECRQKVSALDGVSEVEVTMTANVTSRTLACSLPHIAPTATVAHRPPHRPATADARRHPSSFAHSSPAGPRTRPMLFSPALDR